MIAGIDEAGRGPLAGPVVVSAVILDPDRPIDGLNDSKQLKASTRDRLYDRIIECAAAYSVVIVEPEFIDQHNILQATLWGMRESAVRLNRPLTECLIDGNRVPPDMPAPSRAIVKGDATEPAIMAASILAKVTRDRLMCELALQYPQYGFEVHKGYPTPAHLQALRQFGPCDRHRRSFGPVRALLPELVKTAPAQADLLP